MKLYILALTIALFMFSARLNAQITEPANILGYTWGMPYKTCVKKLKDEQIKFKTNKGAGIIYKDADIEVMLDFDNGLSRIIRSKVFSHDDKTNAMHYFNNTLEKLVDTHGNYLKPRRQESEVLLFEWKFKHTTISILYYITNNSVTVEYAKI